MGFLDDLYREHGQEVQKQVSRELGVDPQRAAQILPQVAPIILGGLKRRMEEEGPDQVAGRVAEIGRDLEQEEDASALLRRGADWDPDPTLHGLLGDKGNEAARLLADQLNLSPAAAARIIPMVAPLIISLLMKHGRSAGGPAAEGGATSGIISILDRNGDGNVLDDLAGLVGGAGRTRGGCLSVLLGGALGAGRSRRNR